MRTILLFIVFYLALLPFLTCGQDQTNFTQFFINPYSINPSYAGIEGKNAFFLSYRKQWAGLEGAPTIANFSFHSALNGGLNYGINVINDSRGIVSNTGLQLSIAYALVLDKNKFLRFGLSAGSAWNAIDFSGIDASDPILTDPSLTGMLDKNFSLLGSAGISFHLNGFHFGFSLPNIFSPSYVSKDAFTITKVKPFQAIITQANYRIYFARDKYVFEPYLVYRLNTGLPSQFEVAGVLHLNHKLWVGGSYKQDFGISALGGIKVNDVLAIGGSYTLKNSGINQLNSPSYEIQLSYLAGNKKKNAEVYSFVSTVKEKEKKTSHKSASQALAERRKQQQDLAKKKQQDLAKKKDEELRKRNNVVPVVAKTMPVVVKPEPVVVVKPEPIDVVAEPMEIHNGGLRFKNEALEPADIEEDEDKAHLERLDTHEQNPTEQHTDAPDFHRNAERHEFVKRGGHQEELDVADYVVGAVFKSGENAKRFSEGLAKMGFAADYGHLTEKNLWYVYISQSSDINVTRAERDKYRKLKIFKDAWLLTVQH